MKRISIWVIVVAFVACEHLGHKLVTGDHAGTDETIITAERIAKIKPGVSTEDDIREIFDNKIKSQRTYLRPLKKKHKGRLYTIDKILIMWYVPVTSKRLSTGVTHHYWSDRIFLSTFMTQGVVQFYEVNHETRNERLGIVLGPLDTDGVEDEPWTGSDCDLEYFATFTLKLREDRYTLQKCEWYPEWLQEHIAGNVPDPKEDDEDYKECLYPKRCKLDRYDGVWGLPFLKKGEPFRKPDNPISKNLYNNLTAVGPDGRPIPELTDGTIKPYKATFQPGMKIRMQIKPGGKVVHLRHLALIRGCAGSKQEFWDYARIEKIRIDSYYSYSSPKMQVVPLTKNPVHFASEANIDKGNTPENIFVKMRTNPVGFDRDSYVDIEILEILKGKKHAYTICIPEIQFQ